jgi:hypothetical protein
MERADFGTRRTAGSASCLHNVSDRDHLTSRGGSLIKTAQFGSLSSLGSLMQLWQTECFDESGGQLRGCDGICRYPFDR